MSPSSTISPSVWLIALTVLIDIISFAYLLIFAPSPYAFDVESSTLLWSSCPALSCLSGTGQSDALESQLFFSLLSQSNAFKS